MMYNPDTSAIVKVHVSIFATIFANLPAIDYAFRIGASTIAIIAGAPVAWKVIKGLWAKSKEK